MLWGNLHCLPFSRGTQGAVATLAARGTLDQPWGRHPLSIPLATAHLLPDPSDPPPAALPTHTSTKSLPSSASPTLPLGPHRELQVF